MTSRLGTKIKFEANILLVECLKLAYVSDRTGIENSLLLPPREGDM